VLSETLATPLPAALPLFGSGVIALAGFAWRKKGRFLKELGGTSLGEQHCAGQERMPQLPKELEKSCRVYARLVEEIKRRQSVIAQVLNGTMTMPQMAAFEFCYLQLRKICEVFALGCLAAHGDIPEVRSKLQTTYNADQIMKHLARIHSRFYPVPSKQTVDHITQKPIAVSRSQPDF
jgi:hypothetical protein